MTWFEGTPIHGAPVVNPAIGVASHWTGVRESSRDRSDTMRKASSALFPSSWRIS